MRTTTQVLESFRKEIADEVTGYNLSMGRLNTIGKRGFPRNGTFVIGGRPGSGKTAFATNIIADILMNGKNDDINPIVMYWNFEMTAEDQMVRLICNYADITMNELYNPEFRDKNKAKLNDYIQLINSKMSKVLWEDIPSNVEDMLLKVRSVYELGVKTTGNKPDIINVIDHTRLIKSTNPNEEVRITELARTCTYMKKEFKTLSILISQMNREIEKGEFRFPKMSDIFGADSVVQEADHILMLMNPYRDGHNFHRDSRGVVIFTEDLVTATLVKSRTSEPGRTFPFKYTGNKFRFEETEFKRQ
jgi:replicative DNA helicase